ncbi:hypothetical protein [Streptomyces sp. NPDC058157]
MFMYRGNMAVGVTGDDLMVRVGPESAPARPGTRVNEHRTASSP